MISSSVGREYHDRNLAAPPVVGTVQGLLPGFTSILEPTVARSHIGLTQLPVRTDTIYRVRTWATQAQLRNSYPYLKSRNRN